jgi:hypothetical protein
MKKKAIVSIAIGEQCLADWQRFCAGAWQSYAARHGLDLIVVSQPLVQSERGASWQKCVVLQQPFAAQYHQIALLDTDIAINPTAPNIFEQVPEDRVGGVISGSHIHEDLRPVLMSRKTKEQLPYERGLGQWDRDQAGYYVSYGLSACAAGIVQGGVLVASPANHAALFRGVFDGDYLETRLYEQIPLSHAILTTGMFQQIDTRFNSSVFETLLVHHSYLFRENFGEPLLRTVVRAEYANNFFLHFAYDHSLLRFLVDE